MSTIAEIETAIERLPAPQVDQLARWLDAFRMRRATPSSVETWLEKARGAVDGMTTAKAMVLTRGED